MPTRPLRILQILRAPVGGLFRHVNDLTRELAARGHLVGLAVDSLSSDSLTAGRLSGLEPHAALGIHSMPMPRVLGPGDLTSPRAVRRLARELAIDILHGHGAKGGFNARLGRVGARGRAALYTPHGGVLNYKPGSAAGTAFRLIERALLPITDAIVFESAFARRAFHEQIGEPGFPNPVIHNGLSLAEFEPLSLDPGARDFVFIGELRPIKGIAYLLQALTGVSHKDGRPATLMLVGDGPDREAIEEQIGDLGLGARVTLPGAQPARAALRMGRCSVVPSLAESLPYVILEAASAARPVIATDVGGVSEIFGPTRSSLVPAGDADALRRAMQAFIDDPDHAQLEMTQRLDFIRTRFSVSHMTDQIEALYLDVLARR